MTEILTESFCERCGTRYTFESSAPRRSRVGRVRTFSRGVKNFVMSDEASFSEAMADARGEEELAATAHQLDAFHKTFNFCLTCRQYTCGDCWNVSEGRCLTCAPMAGIEEPGLAAAGQAAAVAGNGHVHEDAQPDIWPEADLSQDRLARALGAEGVADAAVAEPVAEDEVPSQLEVDAASRAFDIPLEADVDHALTVDEAWREAAAALDAEALEATAATAPSPVEEPAFGEPEAVLDAAPSIVAPEAAVAQPTDEVTLAEDDVVDIGAAGMAASAADDEAEFEAQASAAEQDATAEAVMDPALDFEDDGIRTVAGVAPGQSLEEAIAAYEARLAAEEAEETDGVATTANELATAAAAIDSEPAAEAQAAPEPAISATAEPEAVEIDAVADKAPAVAEPVAAEVEPVLGAPEPEPIAAEIEPEPVVAEALAAAVVVDSVADAHEAAPEPVAADATDDRHELAVLAAAAAAAEHHHAEPEPVAAAPEPEPEPVAADAAPREDVVPQPTWPTAPAPEPEPVPAPAPSEVPGTAPWLMVAPEETPRSEPEWPATPAWRANARNTDAPTTLAGRTLLPQPDASALWAASAREVMSAPIVDAAPNITPQPCVQCGLSLSASARFCRRCGTRQG